jgi:hypothetical protein
VSALSTGETTSSLEKVPGVLIMPVGMFLRAVVAIDALAAFIVPIPLRPMPKNAAESYQDA